jgi:hypothetical protein
MKPTWWSIRAKAGAAAAALAVAVSGCGDDPQAATSAAAPSTTVDLPSPTSITTSTTPALEGEVVDVDDGRVLLHLPDGLTLLSSETITGISGETIRLWRYHGASPVVLTIAVSRGPGAVEMLHSPSNTPSEVAAFEDREYFESHNELANVLGSKSLGWQIGPDAVVWVTATGLTIDEIADIAQRVEVV